MITQIKEFKWYKVYLLNTKKVLSDSTLVRFHTLTSLNVSDETL